MSQKDSLKKKVLCYTISKNFGHFKNSYFNRSQQLLKFVLFAIYKFVVFKIFKYFYDNCRLDYFTYESEIYL